MCMVTFFELHFSSIGGLIQTAVGMGFWHGRTPLNPVGRRLERGV